MKTLKVPKRSMSADEVENLEREIESKESMLKASEEFGDGEYSPALPREVSIDKEKIKQGVKHLKQVLERERPPEVNEEERDKLIKRNKVLEDKFRDHLETWHEIGLIRADSYDYKEAVKKAQRRGEVERYIQEWKENCKRIDPSDPDYSSLDRLRKNK